MQGKYLLPDGVRLIIVNKDEADKPVGGHGGELADFIYYNVRCAQIHEAEIDYDLIDIGREFGIGREGFKDDGDKLEPGKFIVSKATVFSLILSIICAPENKRIRLSEDVRFYN